MVLFFMRTEATSEHFIFYGRDVPMRWLALPTAHQGSRVQNDCERRGGCRNKNRPSERNLIGTMKRSRLLDEAS